MKENWVDIIILISYYTVNVLFSWKLLKIFSLIVVSIY